jgi:hypothetical protein
MTGFRRIRVFDSCLMTVGRCAAAALLTWSPCAVLPAQAARAVQSTRSSAPAIDELYATAAARLLGPVGDQAFVLLPTSAGRQVAGRARPGSGEAHVASATTASHVARLLARRGYRGTRGVRADIAPSAALQLVLGTLRFEPPHDPHFARLAIEVIGSDGNAVVMEFLLKREPQGWRAIQMESKDNIG